MPVLWITFGLGLITYLHYTTTPGLSRLHTVYRYFYFLPIVYAALRFGYWGGLLAALTAAAVFAPYIFFKWGNFPDDSLNDLLVVVVFFGVAIITGITVERLVAAEAQQARTVEELAASLRRLAVQGEELRRAERLSALGLLAGGLAHEIRNPVGIIRAGAQLLAMECDPVVAEATAIIQQETDRIEKLIQSLLDYAGGESLTYAPCQVPALLAQVVERLKPLTAAAGVVVTVRQATNLPPIDLDAEQMERGLVNLCMNAVQALDRTEGVGNPQGAFGRGQVVLDVQMVPDDLLELRVVDNGPGIAAEDQGHVFDPFYTTKENGAGLGLSMVQRIVQDHGGRIWVESEAGHGATFVIQLPVCPRA